MPSARTKPKPKPKPKAHGRVRPGQYAGKGVRYRAVPYGPDRPAETRARLNAEHAATQPERFDARDALHRSGVAARGDAARTVGIAEDTARAADRYASREPGLIAPSSLGELLVYAAASVLGLIALDVALSGRGPAGIQKLLDGLGTGVRKLVDPNDPIVGQGVAPPSRAGIGLGKIGPNAGIDVKPGNTSSATRKGLYPLGKRGPVIGTPNAGTHTLGNWESDNAVDLAVAVGTPVYAVTSGTIGSQIGAFPGVDPKGKLGGLRVHLMGGGTEFYYAHLSRLAVKAGEKVTAGQVIGYSGSVVGVPHLHFSVRNGSIFSWIQAKGRAAGQAVHSQA